VGLRELPDSPKVAIVAALEREFGPFIKDCQTNQREFAGQKFKFFEKGQAVLVCGGIGAAAARQATEGIINLYKPQVVLSAGFAGALEPGLRVGQIVVPRLIIDAHDGSRVETGMGEGVLVSAMAIADTKQKSKLAEAYGAQIVDMEAAAVMRRSEARGVNCLAIKVVSDEVDFDMLALERFVGSDGRFRTGSFVAYFILRPWHWLRICKLWSSSRRASAALCLRLEQFIRQYAETRQSGQQFQKVKLG